VALCQDPELVVSRFELLFDPKFTSLAQVVAEDLVQVSPETKVNQVRLPLRDPWDFEEVYGALHAFARQYDFRPDREDYLVHITTGTHVAQICLFLLAESRHLPGRLIQTGPPNKRAPRPPGTRSIIDLDLSKYDRLASRFQVETTEARSFLKQGIATKNAAYNALIDQMEHVALRTLGARKARARSGQQGIQGRVRPVHWQFRVCPRDGGVEGRAGGSLGKWPTRGHRCRRGLEHACTFEELFQAGSTFEVADREQPAGPFVAESQAADRLEPLERRRRLGQAAIRVAWSVV
jgi:hypothetical protein